MRQSFFRSKLKRNDTIDTLSNQTMGNYFKKGIIAQRYNHFRPKVHKEIVSRVSPFLGPLPKRDVLDIACGTGHSTEPLISISDSIIGIDSSEEMLSLAIKHPKIHYKNCFAEEIHTLGTTFDLINVSLAFHWFDQAIIIPRFKQVSKPNSFWLFYNFYFGGARENKPLSDWFDNEFSQKFPIPPRGKGNPTNLLENDSDLVLVVSEKDSLPVIFTQSQFCGYLSTITNVTAQFDRQEELEEIDAWLIRNSSPYFKKDQECFSFTYSFQVYKYFGKGSKD